MTSIHISGEQKAFHIATEAASVAIGLPLLLVAASKVKSRGLKALLIVNAAAILLVDGGLLLRWLSRDA